MYIVYSGTHFLSRPCTVAPISCLNSRVDTWRNGVFTLLQRLCSTRAPCPGSKREPYLSSTCFFCFSQYIAFKKMTRAALIIQNQYRTHREHERFKKSRRAAAIIQNTFRSYRERRRSTQRRREQRLSKRQEARYIQKASNRYLYRAEFQGRQYTSSSYHWSISSGFSVFSSVVVWKGLRRNNVNRWPECFSRKLSKVTWQVDVVLWSIERSCHPKLTMMAFF